MKSYKIPFEDWDKVDLNNAEFILAEAKEYEKYLSAESDRITERAFAMIRILLPTVIVLVGLFVKSTYNSSLSFLTIYIGISIAAALYFIYQYYRLKPSLGFICLLADAP